MSPAREAQYRVRNRLLGRVATEVRIRVLIMLQARLDMFEAITRILT